MAIHNEDRFESEICGDMRKRGWRYTPPAAGEISPDARLYDRKNAILPDDLIEWLQISQPETWNSLVEANGGKAQDAVVARLRKALDKHGTLHVLRHGFEMLGLRRPIEMAQFKPALAMNPDLQAKYDANILRVVRQLRYSVQNENCIDLVLFLNGLPVATVEVKTDYTQTVENAEEQYKNNRMPKPAGKGARPEPLLSFPRGALVHFALSNSRVRMTTELKGDSTRFIPFDQGSNGAGRTGGAGNPANERGYATSYLWQKVWERHSWLDIIGRFMVMKTDIQRQPVQMLFPRFHQLDSTRKLVADVLKNGPGSRYLIQHSAGSGKTNSISWAASHLADLHDGGARKVFDSVIVVSDRTVLDEQLRGAIESHERVRGGVAYVVGARGSKSEELNRALQSDKKIIVCTLQTFPALYKKSHELAMDHGKRFAVIADEAHSSQASENASKIKMVLADKTETILEPEETVSSEDAMNDAVESDMETRSAAGASSGITFIGYTATPKDRTVQLFGTRPDPTRPQNEYDNIPEPFHVYSMRQAIEEGFIIDVLKNYISYKTAFRLANHDDDTLVDEANARAGILGWVDLHSTNIARHVELVVEHFRQKVGPLLGGEAKAMVVTSSRSEAVRWQLAAQKYIQEKSYCLKTLVAFSGEIGDEDIVQDEPLNETSKVLNPELGGKSIREAFSSKDDHEGRRRRGDYSLLLVADKFQTGFDEPLLCGMYVHKHLSGVAAVQTLSRLNRAYPGKDTTYIVDFTNRPEDIKAAFQRYYEEAEIESMADPDTILEMRASLDAAGYYTDEDVDRLNEIVFHQRDQSGVDSVLAPLATSMMTDFNRAKEIFETNRKDSRAAREAKNLIDTMIRFKGDMNTYVRAYGFLSQIYNYGNTDIEKRYRFYRLFGRLLKFDRETDRFDMPALELTHHDIQEIGRAEMVLKANSDDRIVGPDESEDAGLIDDGMDDDFADSAFGGASKATIADVIDRINDKYGGNMEDRHKVIAIMKHAVAAIEKNQDLINQAMNNPVDYFAGSKRLKDEFVASVIDHSEKVNDFGEEIISSDERIDHFLKAMIDLGLYDRLRNRARTIETPAA